MRRQPEPTSPVVSPHQSPPTSPPSWRKHKRQLSGGNADRQPVVVAAAAAAAAATGGVWTHFRDPQAGNVLPAARSRLGKSPLHCPAFTLFSFSRPVCWEQQLELWVICRTKDPRGLSWALHRQFHISSHHHYICFPLTVSVSLLRAMRLNSFLLWRFCPFRSLCWLFPHCILLAWAVFFLGNSQPADGWSNHLQNTLNMLNMPPAAKHAKRPGAASFPIRLVRHSTN